MHLRALNRIAIAIVFDETEGCSEPVDRLGKVPVSDVGKHGVNRNRAILQHGKKIRQPNFCIERRASNDLLCRSTSVNGELMLGPTNLWMSLAGLVYLVAGIFLLRKEIGAARGWDKLIALVFIAASLRHSLPEHFPRTEFVATWFHRGCRDMRSGRILSDAHCSLRPPVSR